MTQQLICQQSRSHPMTEPTPPTPEAAAASQFGDSQDSLVEYRSPSGWAVAALVLGLASPLAMVGPLGWIVPAAAVLIGGLATRRLKALDAGKLGRGAALAGLSLGLVFLTAAPVSHLASRWCLEIEAHKVAVEWFDYLRHGEPHKAAQLGLAPEVRQPIDESLWTYYREHPEAKRELEEFVRRPLIRALLALGEAAEIRLYETQEIELGSKRDQVEQIYAVTYQDGDKKKSFFVRLSMDRSIDPASGHGRWRVNGAGGNILPKTWSN